MRYVIAYLWSHVSGMMYVFLKEDFFEPWPYSFRWEFAAMGYGAACLIVFISIVGWGRVLGRDW